MKAKFEKKYLLFEKLDVISWMKDVFAFGGHPTIFRYENCSETKSNVIDGRNLMGLTVNNINTDGLTYRPVKVRAEIFNGIPKE